MCGIFPTLECNSIEVMMLSVLWFVFLDFTDTIINQGLIFKVLSPGPLLSLRVFSFTADLGVRRAASLSGKYRNFDKRFRKVEDYQ